MSNPKECILCAREPEQDEDFIDTDDGWICLDCLNEMKSHSHDIHHEYDFGE